ncbi:MAG: metallophosphoesterase [Leadbetterella sp.]
MRKILLVGLVVLCNSTFGQSIVRGPYLQLGSESSKLRIRFTTDKPTKATLIISIENTNRSFDSGLETTAHSFILDGLKPNSKYAYSIQLKDSLHKKSTYSFQTLPEVKSTKPFTFWCVGDMFPGPTQADVYDGFTKFIGEKPLNLIVTVGDNVYRGGSEEDFHTSFFSAYQKQRFLNQSILLPALGNHDYDLYDRRQDHYDMGYFKVFDLPTQGEQGGIPSESEAYYSATVGNTDFMILDTWGKGKDGLTLSDTGSIQFKWMVKNLKSLNQQWKIVVMHHPPYTTGTYHSDANIDLIKIRQTLVPQFEKFGVDIVLGGHSHVYERSRPIHNHLGTSTTFTDSLHLQSKQTGKYDKSLNSCPYVLNSKKGSFKGTLYIVNGAGGSISNAVYPDKHPIMETSIKNAAGSMYFEVNNDRVDGKFIDTKGNVLDQFTVFKDIYQKDVIEDRIDFLDGIGLEAPWTGEYIWPNNETTKKITLNPSFTQVLTVKDPQSCLQQQFKVNVLFPDDDTDGITNKLDRCFDTDKTKKADKNGCAAYQLDSDKDGLSDEVDDCPTLVNPPKPTIRIENSVSLIAPQYAEYEWYYNGDKLKRTKDNSLTAIKSGNYSLRVYNENGCKSPLSEVFSLVITGSTTDSYSTIYPNPSSEKIFLPQNFTEKNVKYITINNQKGVIVKNTTFKEINTGIDVKNLASGIYFLKVFGIKENSLEVFKFVKP